MKIKHITAAILAGILCLSGELLPPPVQVYAAEAVSEEAHIWDGSIDTSWYSAEQTELHISTAAQLAGMDELVMDGIVMTGQTIILDADIVLNDISSYDSWANNPPANEWEEISSLVYDGFDGTFDGGGHTITGMYGNGIFGHLSENAVVRDLHLDYGFLNIRNGPYNGGIALYCNGGTITGCSFRGSSTIKSAVSGVQYIGGICGLLVGGSITDCHTSGEMNFVNTSASDVSSRLFVGGICGRSESGVTRRCGNEMAISYTSASTISIGGICGEVLLEGAAIEDCFSRADILSQSSDENNSAAGGIAGMIYSDVTVKNCYHLGAVDAKIYTGYLGGIAGYCVSDLISNVYHVGEVRSQSYEGGLIGTCRDNLVLENCYYLAEDAERGVGDTRVTDRGTAESMENMQSADFAAALGEVFVYSEGSYPMLAWELGESAVLYGDVNEDGTISTLDVILLQKVLLGLEQLSENGSLLADMTADGTVDAFDLAVLKKTLLA